MCDPATENEDPHVFSKAPQKLGHEKILSLGRRFWTIKAPGLAHFVCSKNQHVERKLSCERLKLEAPQDTEPEPEPQGALSLQLKV